MRLIRWQPYWNRNPLTNAACMNSGMDRLLENLSHLDSGDSADWSPRVTITELDNHYEVSAELPGLNKDEIKVELKDNMLIISGEKAAQSEQKDRTVHLNERAYGSFTRSFQVPDKIDPEAIKAEFSNGVLTLELPKPEEEKPKEIQISVQ